MENVWPVGHARPTKSFGVALPKQLQAKLEIQSMHGRLVFRGGNFVWPMNDDINIQMDFGRGKVPHPR